MNPYQFPVTCEVCGGEGMGTFRTAGAAWRRGSFITHNNPAVCRDNLDRERRKMEEQRREWARSLKPIKRLNIKEEQRRLDNLRADIDRLKRQVMEWNAHA
jgi:hypothetical protein